MNYILTPGWIRRVMIILFILGFVIWGLARINTQSELDADIYSSEIIQLTENLEVIYYSPQEGIDCWIATQWFRGTPSISCVKIDGE